MAGAVFVHLNGLRLKAAKSALGCLNPLIYANLSAFRDVTIGRQEYDVAKIFRQRTKIGFTATNGWDPITGYRDASQCCLALDIVPS